MPVDIPQLGAPQAPQFPAEAVNSLVQGYMNRPTGFQVASQGINQGLQSLVNYQQLKQQRQLQALGAISELYGNLPRDVAGQYVPGLQKMLGVDMGVPDQSQQQQQGGTPSYGPANGGGSLPGNTMQVPQTSAQTLQPGGQGMGGGSQGTMQPAGGVEQPSEHIINSVNAGAPDFSGHLARISQLQGQIAGLSREGPAYAQKMMPTMTGALTAENASMQAEMAPQQYAKTGQELSNLQQQIPMEIGKGSAEQQNKYNLPETKIQVAASKLQDLWDAFQKVPATQTGPGVGTLTSRAGSFAGGAAPAVVTYNKLREAAAVSLAIARNPENPRPSPQDIQDELRNLPSVGDAPQVAMNLFNSVGKDLQTIHNINTQSSQKAAGAFGGNIQPAQTPSFNFNRPQTQGGLPPVRQGMVRIQSSDGGIHDVPSLQAAQKLDRGAKLYRGQ